MRKPCKRAWPAQEILVLLNDLAHNFITAFRRMVLTDTPLAEFGPYRLIQEVFNIPDEVVMRDERLVELRLLETLSLPISQVSKSAGISCHKENLRVTFGL